MIVWVRPSTCETIRNGRCFLGVFGRGVVQAIAPLFEFGNSDSESWA